MLNSELVRDFPDTRTFIIDIQSQTENGTYINTRSMLSVTSGRICIVLTKHISIIWR